MLHGYVSVKDSETEREEWKERGKDEARNK
jgi:hypothetical protein